jgi:hypothetical protein
MSQGKEPGMRSDPRRRTRAPVALAALALIIAVTCAANALPGATEQNIDSATPIPSGDTIDMTDRAAIPSVTWKMAEDVPVWKSIRLGTYAGVNRLREALDSDDCGQGQGQNQAATAERPDFQPAAIRASRVPPRCRLGDGAGEIIGRPAFHLSRIKQQIDLVVVSLVELGFAADANVALEDIYDRAELLNYSLCPAEVGPQLRLQYLDQPAGEFLHVAMEPIATFAGDPTDLTVGNDSARLLLLGGDARPSVTVPASTRFVFVRWRPVSTH